MKAIPISPSINHVSGVRVINFWLSHEILLGLGPANNTIYLASSRLGGLNVVSRNGSALATLGILAHINYLWNPPVPIALPVPTNFESSPTISQSSDMTLGIIDLCLLDENFNLIPESLFLGYKYSVSFKIITSNK